MKTLPEINTAQLMLRRMELKDRLSLVKYANNEKIAANIFNISYPYTENDEVRVIANGLSLTEYYTVQNSSGDTIIDATNITSSNLTVYHATL